MEIINLEIDFVTIRWANTMAYQYQMPKNITYFKIKIFYKNITGLLIMDIQPNIVIDIMNL